MPFIYKVLKSIPEYSTTLKKTKVHHWRRYDLVANRVLGEIDLCLLKPCNNYKGLCLLVDANCRYLWCAKIKSKQKPDVEKALDEILKKSGHFESREIIHAKSRITLQCTYPCFFFRNCKWWWIEIFEKLFFEEEYLVSCITENSACFICWGKYFDDKSIPVYIVDVFHQNRLLRGH